MKAFARLRRDYYGKWCRRHPDNKSRHDPTGVYAFENVRDGKPILEVDDTHNIHVHWALHIPPHLAEEFACEVERWVEVVTGGIRDDFAIRITTRPPKVMRRYLLKGIRELWAETYGATAEPQGTIVGGRRTGTSTNLNRTRRIEADRARGIRRRIPARPSASYTLQQSSQ